MPGTPGRNSAVLLPTSGLTCRFRNDAGPCASSRHEVYAGDGSRFDYQAEKRTLCPATERVLDSTRLLATEISAYYGLHLVKCGELADRPRIFAVRVPRSRTELPRSGRILASKAKWSMISFFEC